MKVWLYLPEKKAEPKKLPLILIAPAGSPLITGMNLGEDDRQEHFPYVKAGFAVVAFEIDGHVPQEASDSQFMAGVKDFKEAQAGLANARTALDFALAKAPAIDPERIFTAGHSSAATLSLLVAQHDPRIKGCLAYAPVTDVVARVKPFLAQLARTDPGFGDFLRDSSPMTHAAKLKCPLFLFHAEGDKQVLIGESIRLAAALKKTNTQVTFVRDPGDNHYDTMMDEGIPKAIDWLKKYSQP